MTCLVSDVGPLDAGRATSWSPAVARAVAGDEGQVAPSLLSSRPAGRSCGRSSHLQAQPIPPFRLFPQPTMSLRPMIMLSMSSRASVHSRCGQAARGHPVGGRRVECGVQKVEDRFCKDVLPVLMRCDYHAEVELATSVPRPRELVVGVRWVCT
jgi:hypothetical protein